MFRRFWHESGIADRCQQATRPVGGGLMPAHKALPIELSSVQERELNALVRAHSTPQKLAERARIILLAASGLGVEEIADELGIWRKTASTWRRRWMSAEATAGVAARLSDAPRSGAPARFTPEMICRIVAFVHRHQQIERRTCRQPRVREASRCRIIPGSGRRGRFRRALQSGSPNRDGGTGPVQAQHPLYLRH